MYIIKYDFEDGDYVTMGIEIEVETWQNVIDTRNNLRKCNSVINIEIFDTEY
jgi:hypothetical protein